jgi:hypothetical protein
MTYDVSSLVHRVTLWSREISMDAGVSYRNEGKGEFQNESIVLLANKKDSWRESHGTLKI